MAGRGAHINICGGGTRATKGVLSIMSVRTKPLCASWRCPSLQPRQHVRRAQVEAASWLPVVPPQALHACARECACVHVRLHVPIPACKWGVHIPKHECDCCVRPARARWPHDCGLQGSPHTAYAHTPSQGTQRPLHCPHSATCELARCHKHLPTPHGYPAGICPSPHLVPPSRTWTLRPGLSNRPGRPTGPLPARCACPSSCSPWPCCKPETGSRRAGSSSSRRKRRLLSMVPRRQRRTAGAPSNAHVSNRGPAAGSVCKQLHVSLYAGPPRGPWCDHLPTCPQKSPMPFAALTV